MQPSEAQNSEDRGETPVNCLAFLVGIIRQRLPFPHGRHTQSSACMASPPTADRRRATKRSIRTMASRISAKSVA